MATPISSSVPETNTTDTLTGSGSTVERKVGGNLGKDDFLKLMVAQMSHMDPLAEGGSDPSKSMDTMTQFSILEQMTNLAKSNETLASATRTQSAVSLLGKTVTYPDKTTGDPKTGVVTSIQTTSGATATTTVTVGDEAGVDPADITEVK